MKRPAVYIMSNKKNGALYTGVTSQLARRVYEHKEGLIEGFTSRYDCKHLVFFEMYESMPLAIAREKQIKGGSRKDKIKLIESSNPEWRDLYEEVI